MLLFVCFYLLESNEVVVISLCLGMFEVNYETHKYTEMSTSDHWELRYD